MPFRPTPCCPSLAPVDGACRASGVGPSLRTGRARPPLLPNPVHAVSRRSAFQPESPKDTATKRFQLLESRSASGFPRMGNRIHSGRYTRSGMNSSVAKLRPYRARLLWPAYRPEICCIPGDLKAGNHLIVERFVAEEV